MARPAPRSPKSEAAAGNPYAPPAATTALPVAIGLYRTYAAVMAAAYVAVAFAWPATRWAALPVAAFFLVAACAPRRPWGWSLGAAAIAAGVTSPAIVIALPLFFVWRTPRVKAAFGRLFASVPI